MTITTTEYVENVVNKLRFEPNELLEQLTTQKVDLLHMALGISGEILEIELADPTDITHVREEMGDLLFYVFGAIEASGQKMELPELSEEELFAKYIKEGGVEVWINILQAAEKLVNDIKQHTVLGKDLEDLTESAVTIIENVSIAVSNLGGDDGYTLGNLLKDNMDKLSKRHHKGKFQQDTALEKADHVEAAEA